MMKNESESENIKWINLYTKPCPRCRKPIEKNQGCNHINCVSCKFDFCWMCLGDWKLHTTKDGTQYYKCNKYEA